MCVCVCAGVNDTSRQWLIGLQTLVWLDSQHIHYLPLDRR